MSSETISQTHDYLILELLFYKNQHFLTFTIHKFENSNARFIMILGCVYCKKIIEITS